MLALRPLLVSSALGLALGLGITTPGPVLAVPDVAAGQPGDQVAQDEGLASRVAGDRFNTKGDGTWHVAIGSHRLRTDPAAPRTRSATAKASAVGRQVAVSTSVALSAALATARPGDVITMADGTYTSKGLRATTAIGGKRYYGTFVGERSGTAQLPIVLQGSRAAVIDGAPGGDGTDTQYGVYLAGVAHWTLKGFTVTNVAKGIVLDKTTSSVIDGLDVHRTGQEAIHLRAFSTDNVVKNNLVRDTGVTDAAYGEGIYVGSAKSNWRTYSNGSPDACDRNLLLSNDIAGTRAENIDVKEGTTAGIIRGNRLDGASMTGSYADSWIDLKGNGWLVEGNTGTRALLDGFQVHVALKGWGSDNVFRSNSANVAGPGFGFWIQKDAARNQVACANTVVTAASGFANVPCT